MPSTQAQGNNVKMSVEFESIMDMAGLKVKISLLTMMMKFHNLCERLMPMQPSRI